MHAVISLLRAGFLTFFSSLLLGLSLSLLLGLLLFFLTSLFCDLIVVSDPIFILKCVSLVRVFFVFLLKKRAGLQVSFLCSSFQCLFQTLHWCISSLPLKYVEFSNGLYGFIHRKVELFHCSHGHSLVEIVKGEL